MSRQFKRIAFIGAFAPCNQSVLFNDPKHAGDEGSPGFDTGILISIQEEAAECMPYLQRQVELIAPRVIILLGATALKHIDKSKTNFQMSDEAGKFFTLADYPGVQFMVLYHPAALLYNAKLKPAMWKHVKHLRRYLDQNGLLSKTRAS